MSCETIESKIALLASGDLPAGETKAVAKHLADCASCRELLDDFRVDRYSLGSLKAEEIDRAERLAVRSAVLARIKRDSRSGEWFASLVRPASWGAAVLAVLVLLIFWPRPSFVPPTPPGKTSVAESRNPRTPDKVLPAIVPGGGNEPVAPVAERGNQGAKRRGDAIFKPGAEQNTAMAVRVNHVEMSEPAADDIAIKLETDDPNVVIIWLASSREGEQR